MKRYRVAPPVLTTGGATHPTSVISREWGWRHSIIRDRRPPLSGHLLTAGRTASRAGGRQHLRCCRSRRLASFSRPSLQGMAVSSLARQDDPAQRGERRGLYGVSAPDLVSFWVTPWSHRFAPPASGSPPTPSPCKGTSPIRTRPGGCARSFFSAGWARPLPRAWRLIPRRRRIVMVMTLNPAGRRLAGRGASGASCGR